MPVDPVEVRRERSDEAMTIRGVLEAAFNRPAEADLVDDLRRERAIVASFVALRDSRIVAHALFSRVVIEAPGGPLPAVALAPVAVLPEHQRLGIGTRLVTVGLDSVRSRGERIAFVLGDPEYYARFGFSTERARAITSPFPASAYMALELCAEALVGIRGSVRYPAAFTRS